jgi:pimeloyl-ACP methyl ester carboxylesterase
MTAQPFTINVSESVLSDLRSRLARTRWTDEIEGAGWDYGTNRDYLKSLVDYWQNGFDWRAQEAMLNQFPHFRAEVDGVGIHFIHVRGKGPNPQPLILTHGWPDSFVRMLKVIPMLTDPARFGGDPSQSFDVVVPSIPGFGFSDRPRQRGMNTTRTAELWAKLMRDVLGYERFGAAGGDLGSVVTMHLAHKNPELLMGIHLTDVSYPQEQPEGVPSSEAAGAYFQALGSWWMNEGAYNMLQSTKPQTVAYSLVDSPVGLAAWIVEKFRSWGDCHGDVESRFSKDELLTNIMIYWVTETISSSVRMYYEEAHNDTPLYPAPRIEVPVGVAKFKDVLPPREWVEHAMNLQRWEEMPRGGHFAALEEPELFVGELRAFFGSLAK